LHLSPRVTALKPSTTLALNTRAKALRAEGNDVLSFAAGEPDFPTPQKIVDAAIAALNRGETRYAPVPGDPATRAVIAEKLTAENGIAGLSADHIVVSSGGKQALTHALAALIDPCPAHGTPDQVLIPVPAWVSYAPMVRLAGAQVVELPTTPQMDYKITPDQLRTALSPRTKALILNSPSNPCGTMYDEEELRALAQVIADAARTTCPDLCIITDELYEKIVLSDIAHVSIGSFDEVASRSITVGGLSKAYAMTGWRVGYLACPGEFGASLASAAAKLQSQSTTSIATFILPAVRTALTECAADVERMRVAFVERGQAIYSRISAIPGIACPKPTGAFYVFADISSHFGKTTPNGVAINSAADFAEALLIDHLVACIPGEDFGAGGENCCRFTFACSIGQIRDGMDRLGAFVASLR